MSEWKPNDRQRLLIIEGATQFYAAACCFVTHPDEDAAFRLLAMRPDILPPGKEREYMRAVANFVLKITEEPK